jgi:hypothetical protein
MTTTTTTKTATTLSRRRTTCCSKWRKFANLGIASKKERRIHTFVGPAKGVKKKRVSAPQHRQLSTVCFDDFHRNFSAAGGTGQLILPGTQTSQT